MADYEAVARAHMAQQVRQAGTVQVALARLWDKHLDPTDVQGSFLRFRRDALVYIGAGRTISDRTALRYIDNLAELADVTAPSLAAAGLDDVHIEASLSAATAKSLRRARSLESRGLDPSVALSIAKGNMLGAAKRHVLNAGRDRLMRSSTGDGFNGWARVSDGAPCPFCSMLVSRGPVYSARSGSFGAHDRCGCSVRLVPHNDPTGGWSDQALRLRELWERTSDDPSAWRATIELARKPLALAA